MEIRAEHLKTEEEAQSLLKQEEPPKGFRPEHLKRMGVSINKGDVE